MQNSAFKIIIRQCTFEMQISVLEILISTFENKIIISAVVVSLKNGYPYILNLCFK